MKPAPKLTPKHLQPSHFEKMKVAHSMAIFSKCVSAALLVMVEADVCDRSALTTAWFLEIVNHWFDLMSSRHPVMALSKFDHTKYVQAVEFHGMVNGLFRNITTGKEGHWKPVQSGITLSTTAMLQAHQILLWQSNFEFVLTSQFSEDCLENFISCIQRKNATPTSLEFKNNLRVLTVAQYLTGSDTGVYEPDEGPVIADFIGNVDVPSVCGDDADMRSVNH